MRKAWGGLGGGQSAAERGWWTPVLTGTRRHVAGRRLCAPYFLPVKHNGLPPSFLPPPGSWAQTTPGTALCQPASSALVAHRPQRARLARSPCLARCLTFLMPAPAASSLHCLSRSCVLSRAVGSGLHSPASSAALSPGTSLLLPESSTEMRCSCTMCVAGTPGAQATGWVEGRARLGGWCRTSRERVRRGPSPLVTRTSSSLVHSDLVAHFTASKLQQIKALSANDHDTTLGSGGGPLQATAEAARSLLSCAMLGLICVSFGPGSPHGRAVHCQNHLSRSHGLSDAEPKTQSLRNAGKGVAKQRERAEFTRKLGEQS